MKRTVLRLFGLIFVLVFISSLGGMSCTRNPSSQTSEQSWYPTALTPEEQIQNLVLNPDFEMANDPGDLGYPFPGYWLPGDWQNPNSYTNIVWDTNVPRSGTHSLKLIQITRS